MGREATLLLRVAEDHDRAGRETEAVLSSKLAGAFHGLGSTYRTLGRYDDALRIWRDAMQRFLSDGSFGPFLAMTLYNLGRPKEALASTQPTWIVDRRDRAGVFAKRICYTNRFIEHYNEVRSTKVEDDGAATRHEDRSKRTCVAQIIREFGNARARFVIVRRIHQHS